MTPFQSDHDASQEPDASVVLCPSALSASELDIMEHYPTRDSMNDQVTHLVLGQDGRRTFKYLKAVALGKWIVSSQCTYRVTISCMITQSI